MVRARSIIPRTLRRIRTEEHAACIDHPFGGLHVIGRFDNQMFGRVAVGQFQRLVHIAHHDEFAVGQCLLRDFLARKGSQLAFHFVLYLADQSFVGRHQQDLAVHAMLGLRKQVGRHEYRIGTGVSQYLHLRRSGGHVNGYIMKRHLLLGRHDVLIAGAEYLIHFGHAFRTVGHGANGLHTARLENTVHSSHTGCAKDGRMHLAVAPRRRAKHDFTASGNLGRCGQHQHRGEKRCRPSGYVKPHPFYGNGFLPTGHPGTDFHLRRFKALGSVELPYIVVRQAQGILQFRRHQTFGLVHFFFRDGQTLQFHMVELLFVGHDGAVAARLHVVQHPAYGFTQRVHVHYGTFQQFVPFFFLRIFYHIHLLSSSF